MNQELRQMLVVALLGLIVFAIVMVLSRNGKLTLRYTLGWAAVSTLGIMAGLLIPLVQPFSDFLGLSAATFVALIAVSVLLAISIQLSISISGMQKQIQTLSEEIARLCMDFAGDVSHSESDL